MSRDSEFGDDLLALGIGIIGGLAAVAILSALFKPKCPVCHKIISNGISRCPHCGYPLEWGENQW
jgi:hypothetical protein